MQAQERKLHNPKNQIRNYPIRRDALRVWNPIGQGQITGPDSTKHNTHSITPIHILDREPEYSQNDPGDDRHVGAPETPAGAGDNGEGDVVYRAHGAVPRDDEGHDEEGDGDDGEGFAVGETDGDDAAGELPCCCVEGVGDPVC